ncbi:TetR/AcrR family transcriptional regulator [Rhodococcus sp. HNM0563]|uniref:TetR/AcrR family transcriptional regulator n=1 Tax=Rhodococcus sp. HNM0563 TaxID=2716339 RepID=UPI00146CFCA0|nr:TetR/AcrR family transcriptional regulator [Rhodococcus sp. HNM0563]NLU61570.1 TetR/AcrR family transcriptional regulator [Rhodococcus sp. HNM0563]
MSERTTRDTILDAARPLFTERGFNGTTIRDIAEAAGVSPALVMKLTGSKAELFQAAAPESPGLTDADHPDEAPGYRLVRAIVDRRDSGDYEFWAMAPYLVQEAPDPEGARAGMTERMVPRIAAVIGEHTTEMARARMVVTLLLGLASGVRTFEILTPQTIDSAKLIETYGALVQQIIDDTEL